MMPYAPNRLSKAYQPVLQQQMLHLTDRLMWSLGRAKQCARQKLSSSSMAQQQCVCREQQQQGQRIHAAGSLSSSSFLHRQAALSPSSHNLRRASSMAAALSQMHFSALSQPGQSSSTPSPEPSQEQSVLAQPLSRGRKLCKGAMQR